MSLAGQAMQWLSVAVALPAHSVLDEPLLYRGSDAIRPGTLVRVPLGKRVVLGVAWRCGLPLPAEPLRSQARDVAQVLDAIPPLAGNWLELIEFAARYYQRTAGEVALTALPPQLRNMDEGQLQRRLRAQAANPGPDTQRHAAPAPKLNPAQADAVTRVVSGAGPFLLHGVTGSGKTEVYLQAAQRVLERDAQAQILVLVPEINLTPQLEERFAARFGAQQVAALHSGLTPARRLQAWLAAHLGRARVVLGTRVAVLASLSRLALVVVDEEHDASYKQQEGARYSARDLALYRGHQCGVPVVLGSATPSLESWHASLTRSDGVLPRLCRLELPSRVHAAQGSAGLPRVRRVDMRREPRGTLLAPALLAAIGETIAAGRQALLLLNRRGYAPLLYCGACGWKSECPNCSAYRVFHKGDRTLRCHHCSLAERVPAACPSCGNLDLAMLGRGTEQLEERLPELLSGVRRPDGSAVRIARIDADSTRGSGRLVQQLDRMHAGEVDVLVGTQMIAKGHDFLNVGLVAAINPDAALHSSDFRAPERLFALLVQAAGRAGRTAQSAESGQMWLQTEQPAHPLYAALKTLDYAGFAERELAARAEARLPPFSHLALLRVDASSQQVAQGLLAAVRAGLAQAQQGDERLAAALRHVTCYPPVPLSIQRVARMERAQMLLESGSRAALQHVLPVCRQLLHALSARGAHGPARRWAIDVDPLEL